MKNLLMMSLAMNLTFGTAARADVCNSMKECRDLEMAAQAKIRALWLEVTPTLAPVVIRADRDCPQHLKGSISPCEMTQSEAEQVCQIRGTRLPDIFELALVFHSLGAHGIRKSAYTGIPESAFNPGLQAERKSMMADNYWPVHSPLGSVDTIQFYYNPTGYPTRAIGFTGYHMSSSRESLGELMIEGETGRISYSRGNPYNTIIRCLEHP